MAVERFLLQKIREKELEISVKIDQARRDADQILERAKREAKEIIEKYEKEGEKAAADYYQKEVQEIHIEQEQLNSLGEQEIKIVHQEGEKNLPRAIEKIVKVVASE